ncbi:MAG: ExeM/NucH family extracellular endonuclease, partial [Fibrobacterota bacterium]
NLSSLTVNDASTIQNPDPVMYPTGGLSDSNTLRTGDMVEGLVGVLDYSFGLWTLQPTQAPIFVHTNPRNASPARRTGGLRVASFNVLNYFTTLGTATECGPTGTLGCRGANDSAEFRRQKSKIIPAILGLDADIVGLMEIENHPTDSALRDLVKGLNDATQAGTWKHVPTGTLGGDAIKVALIYRSIRVEPTDSVARLTSDIDSDFVDKLNRVPLAQTFRDPCTGKRFTVVVNHLKSKGSACSGDPDIGDGQGNCNQVRTRAAKALARWTRSRPTGTTSPHTLMLGDFNAYAKEDPITLLVDSGFVNLGARDEGDSAYSYQFGSAFGMLDHAFATSELADLADARHWNINADEPVVLGYNREFKSPTQIESFFNADPYASSDHDPILVDIDFSPTSPTLSTTKSPFSVSRTHRELSLFSDPALAGSTYQILSLDGKRLAMGTLHKSGRVRFQLDAQGTAYLLVGGNGNPSFARMIALP